jgi:hypothetical protein
MEMASHPLESLVNVELRRDELWAVAQGYERNFYEDLAAGRSNGAITFPDGRSATSWNLDGIPFNGGPADQSMAGLFALELKAAAAIAIWTKGATQRCYTWNFQELRNAFHDPEVLKQRDESEMVSENGRACDLLQNLDLLVEDFDRYLANKLTALNHNEASTAADFSDGVKKTSSEGKDLFHSNVLHHAEKMPATSQMYLIYVLCRRHFIKIGSAWCKLKFLKDELHNFTSKFT